jgi:hypothetical protein
LIYHALYIGDAKENEFGSEKGSRCCEREFENLESRELKNRCNVIPTMGIGLNGNQLIVQDWLVS